MSTTGRYYYRDRRSGRTFCIEPIADRTQKVDDLRWTNGGIDPVQGGAIREEESVITPENGFVNIAHLPPGVSPDGHIEQLLRGGVEAGEG
ncbi:MAG TPA: hypothetical protein VHG51_17960 [Longimicrobiaceae bacterium]|nr:hypothetical protein [Longimicrobiaceae bacterium]